MIDTLPVPVCKTSRAKRSRFREAGADYGYCAAQREYYYGFKLGLRIYPLGMIVHYPLLTIVRTVFWNTNFRCRKRLIQPYSIKLNWAAGLS